MPSSSRRRDARRSKRIRCARFEVLVWSLLRGSAFGTDPSPSKGKDTFLCALVRMRDEHDLLRSFLQHHRWEGVGKFVVVEDTNAREPYRNLDEDVQLLRMNLSEYESGKQWVPLDEISKSDLMRGCEWIMSIDVDEFVSTRRNPCKTVAEEFKDSFSGVDAVNVPWVMFSYNDGDAGFEDVRSDNVMRWNHSVRHSAPLRVRKYKDLYYHDETKPIFRPEKLESLKIHGVVMEQGAKYVDGVVGEENVMDEPFKFVDDFHEPEIAKALIVVNHYRFTTFANILQKCTIRNKDNAWQTDYAIEADKCIAAADASNWREVRDESMRVKYVWRSRGLPCTYEDPHKHIGVVVPSEHDAEHGEAGMEKNAQETPKGLGMTCPAKQSNSSSAEASTVVPVGTT